MQTSEHVNELYAALAKAQKAMRPALKDANNPAFRSKYADLASVWEAVREPLTDNGLSVMQDVTVADGKVAVMTRLAHASGQWQDFGPVVVPMSKADAHGVGSATSYGRRYGLSAATGVVQDDDDGNAAAGKAQKAEPEPTRAGPIGEQSPPDVPPLTKGQKELVAKLEAVAREGGIEAYQTAWKATPEAREGWYRPEHERIKQIAREADALLATQA
jgi:hypothetical protein